MNDELKTYYVTFGLGTFFRDYYQEVLAYDADIVKAFLSKHYPRVWADVKDYRPNGLQPVRYQPFEIGYRRAQDV